MTDKLKGGNTVKKFIELISKEKVTHIKSNQTSSYFAGYSNTYMVKEGESGLIAYRNTDSGWKEIN
ncbi:hypothetical protein ACQKGD_10875 [Peribacillus frigoritolerans]|uniref:hypothetical protein n=1 Tax=Peribacillus frigoritolerans TaxID=450367 RepID=UPI003CFDD192